MLTIGVCHTALLILGATSFTVMTIMSSQGLFRNGLSSELGLSRFLGGCLLILYCIYLYFQLHSHLHLFSDDGSKPDRPMADTASASAAATGTAEETASLQPESSSSHEEEDEEDDDVKILGLWGGIFWLFALTVFIAILSEFLVHSIEGASASWGIPNVFISTILLPIVGNAAEHAAAMTVAYKGKITLSVGVALGSSTQIALFVFPLMGA